MKKHIVSVLFFLVVSFSFFPQSQSVGVRETAIAFGDVLLINMAFNNSARIILQESYAEINLSTMKENLTKSWCWDKDGFFMNQLGHPYQGSLYFNAGRSNGLNFWQSFFLAATGSLIWEELCETTTPSVNDFITTPLCGTVFGESMHRLYLDAAEIIPQLAWLISPIEAFNYAIRGRQNSVAGHTEEIDFIFHGGHAFAHTDFSADESAIGLNKPTVGTGVHIQYGLPAAHDTVEPYDLFTADLDSNFSARYYDLDFCIDGFLFSRALYFENSEGTLGANLMYEGKISKETAFSNAALGIKFFSEKQFSESDGRANVYVTLDGVFLGTRGLYRLQKQKKLRSGDLGNPLRYYNFAVGPLVKAGFSAGNRKLGTFYGEAEASFLIPYIYSKLKESKADKHFMAQTKIGYEHAISTHFSLGLNDYVAFKKDWFVSEANTVQILNTLQIYGKWAFKR